MAKFTAPVPLDLKWNGLYISGATGATHRIPDAYYEEFVEEVVPGIPGGVTWLSTDELGAISTPFHSALQGVTANQHHAQAHSISGADHSGTLAHSALGSIGANDHHAQAHSISGADHTGTLAHSALGSVSADQHHSQVHSISGSDHTGTVGFSQLPIFTIGFASATAGLTLTTTPTDIPGVTYTATPSRAETWVVIGVIDFDASVAGTNVGVGQIVMDTTTQSSLITSTGKTVQRSTVSQVWVLSISAAAHTVKLQASKTVNDGTHVANQTHSTLTVLRLPA